MFTRVVELTSKSGKAKERKGWERGHLCPRSLSTAIPIHISI